VKHRRFLLLGVGVIVIALLLCAIFPMIIQQRRSPLSFSPEQWKAGNPRLRGRMVKDLMVRGLMIGRSADEVREMLGSPDQKGDFKWKYTVDMGHRIVLTPWNYDLTLIFSSPTGGVSTVELRD